METETSISIPAPLKSTRAVLVVQNGLEAGRVVPLSINEPNTIGRADDCNIPIDDGRLSRRHATITCTDGVWTLADEQSKNGTAVDGGAIDGRIVINDGSRILLGKAISFRLAFVTADEELALVRVFHDAVRDGLTSVFNRKALDERLVSECAFAKRHETSICVIMIDIDHFKAINDAHGHDTGDAVLRFVATRLARNTRTEDVVARYGGEEFVVVARDTTLDGAALLAERLRDVLSRTPINGTNAVVDVTASFGVASIACCGAEPTAQRLLSIADARLYAAKRGGRNRVVSTGD